MAFEFAGKVAVVTGGGSGIGRGLVDRLVAEGASVAAADVDASRLEQLHRAYPHVLTAKVDIADPQQTDAFAARTVEYFGAVHVVCANAGIIGPAGARLWEVPADEFRRVVDVNLLGTVNTIRSFVPHVLAAGTGHVAITSSMAGVSTSATIPAYFATKHALVSLAETLSLQLERDGADVGVSVLLPARVTSHLDDSLTLAGAQDPSAGVTGFRPREISPEEVADRFVEAVRARRLYVFTHPEAAPRVQERQQAILDAFTALGG